MGEDDVGLPAAAGEDSGGEEVEVAADIAPMVSAPQVSLGMVSVPGSCASAARPRRPPLRRSAATESFDGEEQKPSPKKPSNPPPPSLATTPQVSPLTSPREAVSPGGTCVGSAAMTTMTDFEAIPKSEADKCTYWIGQLNLQMIIKGDRYKRAWRQSNDLLTRNKNTSDLNLQAGMRSLTQHMGLCGLADKITPQALESGQSDAAGITTIVETLKAAHATFQEFKVQEAFCEFKIATLVDGMTDCGFTVESARELIGLASPWVVPAGQDEDEPMAQSGQLTFQPLEPKVQLMSGTMGERMAFFDEIVFDIYFGPLISAGESMASRVGADARIFLSELQCDAARVVDKASKAKLLSVLNALRSILLVLSQAAGVAAKDSEELLASLEKSAVDVRHAEKSMHKIGCLVMDSEYYKAKLLEVRLWQTKAAKYSQKVQESQEMVATMAAGDFDFVSSITTLLQTLPVWQNVFPEAALSAMEGEAIDLIVQFVDLVEKNTPRKVEVDEGEQEISVEMQYDQAKELLKLAAKVWAVDDQIAAASSELREQERARVAAANKQSVEQHLAPLLNALDKGTIAEIQELAFEAAQKAATTMQADAELQRGSDMAEKVATGIMKVVDANLAKGFMEAGTDLALTLAAALAKCTGKVKQTHLVVMLQAMVALQRKLITLEDSLASSEDEGVFVPPKMIPRADLEALLTQLAKMETAEGKVSGGGKEICASYEPLHKKAEAFIGGQATLLVQKKK